MPLLLAQGATPLAPSPAVSWLLAIIADLIGAVAWFLRQEIKNNREAHRELKSDIRTVEIDVKKLLGGQARIEGLLEGPPGKRSLPR